MMARRLHTNLRFQLVREGQRWLSASPAIPGSRLEGAGLKLVLSLLHHMGTISQRLHLKLKGQTTLQALSTQSFN